MTLRVMELLPWFGGLTSSERESAEDGIWKSEARNRNGVLVVQALMTLGTLR